MDTILLEPRKALNKAFLKIKPNRSNIEAFKNNLIGVLDSINIKESEEFHKNLVSDFLKKTYYDPTYFINTKGRNDLVIHNGKDAKSHVGVIIEAKSPSNRSEMISKQKLNCKALQELVLYYLRERITNKNTELKYLIVTNIYEWFIFDAHLFNKLFAENKVFVKQFNDFETKRASGNKTDYFYKEIAEPYIASLAATIEYTYFDIHSYEKPLRNVDKKDDNKLISLYKLLSPEHLLKLSFSNDSNSLDKNFYTELLHILGLTETRSNGKKIIERNKPQQRNNGSIIENTISQLDSMDKLSRLKNPRQYGNTYEERLFGVALELTITWVNRILFLKLLEAQLISYHNRDSSYSFLSIDKIKDYDYLNTLFFKVLAKKVVDRNSDVQQLFNKVPYLNSSLFEMTELEHEMFPISQLENNKTLPLLSYTVIKDAAGKKSIGNLNTLQYFFAFLDAYDFASEGSEEIQEDNKALINASVLGLIFEKINGYKDGSFFTPGLITMYMCRETIRKAVIQKFNEVKGWHCKSFEDLQNKDFTIKEANTIINSIRICDPAVGSGHFLVSALNEFISIKSKLKILADNNGVRLKEWTVIIENDELVIYDSNDGKFFKYNPLNEESRRVQETLFNEKQYIIENCLFGVDINPNSVKICRLRLWIELLKNAYYKTNTELETLPNIDINIKNGNSLISRFDLSSDLKTAFKKSKISIDDYKNAVADYKNATSKEEKRSLEELINEIKNNFRTEISRNSKEVKDLQKWRAEYFTKYESTQLFETVLTKAQLKYKKELSSKINKVDKAIEEIKSNKIYETAFEWRFEFPEVLDDEGNYVGFDAIIGNPPYIRIQGIRDMDPKLAEEYIKRYQSASGSFDIYVPFVEKGLQLLANNGIVNYIMPVKWTNAAFGSGLRKIISESKSIYKIIDFGAYQAFDASTYTGLQWFQKNSENLQYFEIDKQYKTNNDLSEYLNSLSDSDSSFISYDELTKDSWTLTVGNTSNIINKLNQQPRRMSDVFEKIFQGLATSKDDVYFLYDCTFDSDYVTGFSKQLNSVIKLESKFTKPLLKGEDVHRYENIQTDRVVVFPYRLSNGSAELYREDEIKMNFL
jgi:adenine-specific DNA-methyltransferase